ncbi:SUN-domain-containing protein [Eremomyces bilateralis CBS 781.70]|uniref:SUN-domain-containing protein n=1 Tax=Eremomyces bilateralis CBS 781.70 TaxID=1392243 RepID=A0A6G1GBI1_9PEZI|nr:SUN-domain-containing protein [Eremomyces bilateralis CBS 781.70]KAF1815296.1 SUN-domain-containing protein [Eremomyces bilateralis CBS 781.70]
MKTAAVLSLLAAVAVAKPHPHGHAQFHKRECANPTVVVVYELDGGLIDDVEAQGGVKNGTLRMEDGGDVQIAAKPEPTPSPSPAPASQPVQKAQEKPQVSESSFSSGGGGDASDFPDGELDCSVFPEKYGAVKIPWTNLGGWTGVQKPNEVSTTGFNDIMTVTTSQCEDGNCCVEGAYCSYACKPGYQKVQWPDMQGATGQSVGGLLCKDGKLRVTSSKTKQLCGKGTDKVSVKVKNKMGKNVAICRTDYPGTEAETVPVDAQPGTEVPLTCPDADNFYNWQGTKTSAQYYANPAGVSVEDGCQWGKPGGNTGNYAPMNFGVGFRDGSAWISIFQNVPTTNEKQKYTVRLEGDGMSGTCEYKDGQYCSDTGCNEKGCTVSIASGTIYYILE